MAELSKSHGMVMYQQNDEVYLNAMNEKEYLFGLCSNQDIQL